jgi:anti-sigma regulatory factor (Ser/Thr protein kinase)
VTTARWSFEATREAPGKGRRAVREFAMPAQPTDHALGSIAVCVSEAMTNVVMHAYRDMDSPGQIDVEGSSTATRSPFRSQTRVMASNRDSIVLGLDWACP